MSKTDKLLAKARRNPAGLAFDEFETLLRQCGWEFRRQRGSHRLWKSPRGHAVAIQSQNGHSKAYQVKQFLAILDEDGNHER